MEVAIPAITESGTSYVDWRPLTRDQSMEVHFSEISSAVRAKQFTTISICYEVLNIQLIRVGKT